MPVPTDVRRQTYRVRAAKRPACRLVGCAGSARAWSEYCETHKDDE